MCKGACGLDCSEGWRWGGMVGRTLALWPGQAGMGSSHRFATSWLEAGGPQQGASLFPYRMGVRPSSEEEPSAT